MAGNPDIEAGIHFCHTCRKRTQWAGTKAQFCQGCDKRFPCKNVKCRHLDCDEHRAVWGVQAPEVQETTEVKDPDDLFAYMSSGV